MFYAAGTAVLAWYILSGRNIVRLRPSRLRWPLFRDILGVGAVAAVTSVQTNVIIVLATALVAAAGGAAAAAGYGTAARLEYLLIPLVFGLGAPLVAMVGTNIGAGQRERALRIAMAGGAVAFAITERGGHCRGGLAARMDLAVQRRPAGARRPAPTICASLGRPTDSSASGWRSISPRRAPGGWSGRCCRILRMLVAIGGGWLALRLDRLVDTGCSRRSRSGSFCMASLSWSRSAPAPGFAVLLTGRPRSHPDFRPLD